MFKKFFLVMLMLLFASSAFAGWTITASIDKDVPWKNNQRIYRIKIYCLSWRPLRICELCVKSLYLLGQPSFGVRDNMIFSPSILIGKLAAQPSSGAMAIPFSRPIFQSCIGQATRSPRTIPCDN